MNDEQEPLPNSAGHHSSFRIHHSVSIDSGA
jgi:hypothetical protein